jgi:hypothetical protein
MEVTNHERPCRRIHVAGESVLAMRGPPRGAVFRQAGRRGEPQPSVGSRQPDRRHLGVEEPAAHLARAREDLGEVAVHHRLAREGSQLAQARQMIGGPVDEPLMSQRGGHTVGDDEEQDRVLGGERRARPRRPANSTPTTWASARTGTTRASRTGSAPTKGSRGVASAVRR